MSDMPSNYLWRKQASDAWRRLNETKLLARFAERVAFIEEPGRKRTTVEICCAKRGDAAELTNNFGGTVVRVPKAFSPPRSKPIRIGARLVITDERGQSHFAVPLHLIIPAAGAFGTGEHATTAMCLRMLERETRRWRNGWKMLDAGTGSGILALSAKCFGASSVIAVDNDPRAIAIAKSNARLNRIRGVTFEIANVTSRNTREKIDVISANLFSELLISAIPKWQNQLHPGGVLILSGILRSQERDVLRALRKQEIAIEEIRRRGKWVAIMAANR